MDNTVEEASPVRRTLSRLAPPFWVYVTGAEGSFYPVPHRYHPQGTAVKIVEIELADPHTLTGKTDNGHPVNFGGPNARHWVVENAEALPPEAPEVAPVLERNGSRGESHYLNRMGGSLRKWTIEMGKVSRAIKVSDERIQRYREGIAAEEKRKQDLLEEKRKVSRHLSAAKYRERQRQKKENTA